MTGDDFHEAQNQDTPIPPPVPGETIFVSEPPFSPGSRRPAAYAAVLIGLLAMVAAAVFFVRSVGTAEGSSSPQAAVQRLLDAASNEDVLGVLETLPATERNLFATRLQTLTKELGRLGILRSDVDLSDLQGFDLEFTGVTMRSEKLKEGLAAVEILEGRSTYRVDPATTPLGDFVRKLLPRSAFSSVRGSDDLADDDVVLATVREGDDWYVSLFYTIAEAARREAGPNLSVADLRIEPRGTTTREAAVEELIRAAFGVELRRIVELMPPDEAAALHDYGRLYITDLEAAGAEANRHVRARIRDLDVASRTSGEDHIVTVKRIAFRIDVLDLDSSVEFDGRCATLSGEFFGFDEPQRECGSGLGGVAPLPLGELPDVGFTVVERDGLFYVSPLRTAFDAMIEIVRSVDRQELDMIRQFFTEFLGFGEDFMVPSAVETSPAST